MIVDTLLKNKEFLKWITYLVDDPSSMPDVPPQHIEGNKLILTHVNEKILTEQEIKVFLNPHRGISHKSGVLADIVYEMNITMPNESGYIYGLRVDRFDEIANQVSITLDGQKITGIGEVVVSAGFNRYKINEEYVGMVIFITVTNPTLMELNI